jgi:hypothetical protein
MNAIAIDALPDAVLVFNVLASLEPADLCALSTVCSRFKKMVEVRDVVDASDLRAQARLPLALSPPP